MLPLLFLMTASPQAFNDGYCQTCHQQRFIGMTDPVLARKVIERVVSGSMPPVNAPKQPSEAERHSFADAVARQIALPVPTVLRRLNRREYLNTIGDLFALNMSMFDPAGRFPRDRQTAHMDNIGETLVTSGYLLEQYLDAADEIVNKALPSGKPPQSRTWSFSGPLRQQPELDPARKAAGAYDKFMVLYEHPRTPHHEGAYAPLYSFEGVPADGFYEVRVRAEAVNRAHPYDVKFLGMDPEAPFRLGIAAGASKAGLLHRVQPLEPVLGEVTLGDAGPEWHTFNVWLDAGFQPRFTFPNGMNDVRKVFSQFPRRYIDMLPEHERVNARGIFPGRILMMKYGTVPQIRLHEIHIRGPIGQAGQPASRRAIYGGRPFEPGRMREILSKFAARAYRRPARPGEVDRLVAVAVKRQREGQTPEEALKDALKAALCSPAFLYLNEPDGRLDAYALAARLSYFLWSTMPDGELLRQARTGALLGSDVLLAQTRRLLASPRAKAFVEGFLDSWLNLRSLGDMPPDRDMFAAYYFDDLQAGMRTETQMMMSHLLAGNRSIMDFIDARYSFINKPLARVYGLDASISSQNGHLFRRVEFTDARRGGLLGQGSVLTVTANGIETSPVTRGVWMLENIFGTPPPPPPEAVPALEPDVRGSRSVRDLLIRHRENAVCMSCHRSIDPPGFALESYDPIGRWRDKYPNERTIDSSGELPAGGRFDDVTGLKKLLAQRKPEFARVFTARLLAYATGRRPDPLDRPRANAIAADLISRGYGMRDLVELIVLSEAFRSK